MKRALKISACLSLLALALCLWACQSQKESSPSQGLRIVTSFYPIYSMVKAISGDLNDVRMIQSSSGIHDFEPSANDVAAIYDADVFVYHSRTLESWAGELNPSLKNSKVQVLEASQGMKLDRVAGLEDVQAGERVDEKTLYDPHTWLDPQ
ncbi:metal ABC transporter solute-binding protein, Zn/Mn family, partial [Streptococcus sanguinis]